VQVQLWIYLNGTYTRAGVFSDQLLKKWATKICRFFFPIINLPGNAGFSWPPKILLPPKKLGQLSPNNIFYFALALYFSAWLLTALFFLWMSSPANKISLEKSLVWKVFLDFNGLFQIFLIHYDFKIFLNSSAVPLGRAATNLSVVNFSLKVPISEKCFSNFFLTWSFFRMSLINYQEMDLVQSF
jgi:hypothetical protein